jgi:lysozyme
MTSLVDDLIRHEGYRKHLYEDSLGNMTIGVGYHIEEKGLPDYIIKLLLNDSIKEARTELTRIAPDVHLSRVRQDVLLNMIFNMGAPRLTTFKKMWAAIENNDFEAAANEMLSSKWAKQVGNRSIELAERMRTGK